MTGRSSEEPRPFLFGGNVPETAQGIFLYELGMDNLISSKPIDGLAAGTFIDMNGQRFTFEAADLPTYVENTNKIIAATERSDGTVQGLPIDPQAHNGQDAAGWITEAFMAKNENSDPIVQFNVRWTDVGRELIQGDRQRFFSATIDVAHEAIQGGSLTNWPATRDISSGVPLLRPVELSARVWEFQAPVVEGPSLNDQMDAVYSAWWEVSANFEGPEPYIEDVFPDSKAIIVSQAGVFYKVAFTEAQDGAIEFQGQADWQKVDNVWVEAMQAGMKKLGSIIASMAGRILPVNGNGQRREAARDNEAEDDRDNEIDLMEDEHMKDINLKDLTPEQRAELAQGAIAELATRGSLASMDGVAELIKGRVEDGVKVELAKRERTQGIAQFVQGLTGGEDEDEHKVGIPVPASQLEGFLESLTDDQLEAAKGIFTAIKDKGMVDFEEAGHGNKSKGGKRELPSEYVALLNDKEITVADLSSPMAAADLGPIEDYDISAWDKAGEGE